MVTLYEIAEKCRYQLGSGDLQVLTSAVIDSYATVAKSQFYENKNDGCSEIDGSFIYTFGKVTALTPVLDLSTDQYCIVIPSSYVRLPHEYGINWVSYMKDKSMPFVRINAGSVGMWSNIKAALLAGRQTYYVEGTTMYFPKMTKVQVGDILLKLAIALDTVEVDEPLNISRSVVDQIVVLVVQKFTPKPVEETKALV